MFLLGVGDTLHRGGVGSLTPSSSFFFSFFFSVNQDVTCGMWPHAGVEHIDQAGLCYHTLQIALDFHAGQ